MINNTQCWQVKRENRYSYAMSEGVQTEIILQDDNLAMFFTVNR